MFEGHWSYQPCTTQTKQTNNPEFDFCLCPMEHVWLHRQLWRPQGGKEHVSISHLGHIHTAVDSQETKVFPKCLSSSFESSRFISASPQGQSPLLHPCLALYFARKRLDGFTWHFKQSNSSLVSSPQLLSFCHACRKWSQSAWRGWSFCIKDFFLTY